MKKAFYKIEYDDQDITSQFENRLISLQVTDSRGFNADSLSLELDDTKGDLVFPKRGVKINVQFGFNTDGLIYRNQFVIDECEYSGPPDKLTISGSSANFRDTLNTKQEESYHDSTIEDIITKIAKRNDLDCFITASLKEIKIEHLDQTDESDASFMTRFLQDYGASATIKNGVLLVFTIGAGKTVNGKNIPMMTIERKTGDSFQFSIADREAYTGVKAYWLDYKKAKVESTSSKKQKPKKKEDPLVEDEKKKDEDSVLVGAEGNVKTLRHTYSTKGNAMRGAQNEWAKLQRGACSFSMHLAEARPDLYPEMPVQVVGFKPEIDSTEWTVVKCSHSLTAGSGLQTSVELELKIEEEAESES